MISLESVKQLDRDDPLGHKRDEFLIPDNLIYLDGNSLGALPKLAKESVEQAVNQQWGNDLIHSWNKHHWIDLPAIVGEKIADLIGAARGQVICCDSTSVNLFKVLMAALQLRPGRKVILSQADNFPTDLYMAQGLVQLAEDNQYRLKQVDASQLIDALEQSAKGDEEIAVLMLTHVNFRSGEVHDMKRLTQLAHKLGALVVWDLAHSAGVLPLELDDIGVDFAVGCGYKYLNGGPGAPAFVYVAKRLQATCNQPLTGWMGHSSPFDFAPVYTPAKGVDRFLCGTPAILAMSSLNGALDVFHDVDMKHVREKSVRLTELFIQLVEDNPNLAELSLVTPKKSSLRGSQVAYAHPEAFAICQALVAKNIVADFRDPNILRIGLVPLYNRYQDVFIAVKALEQIFNSKEFEKPEFQLRKKVT